MAKIVPLTTSCDLFNIQFLPKRFRIKHQENLLLSQVKLLCENSQFRL